MDGTIRLLTASTGVVLNTHKGCPGAAFDVAYSPDGAKLAVSYMQGACYEEVTGVGSSLGPCVGETRLWNTTGGAIISAFSEISTSVNFSPDGSKIVMGSLSYRGESKVAKVKDVLTGANIFAFSGHESAVLSASFSPDGTTVISTDFPTGGIKLWSASTGAEIRTFPGGWYPVAFSPDGSRVFTGSKLWDTASGVIIRTFSGYKGIVFSAVFSPDGAKIVTGFSDGTAKLWPVSGNVVPNVVGRTRTDAGAVDSNGDGQISHAEAAAGLAGLTQEVFNSLDADGNGSLSLQELDGGAGCTCQKDSFTPGGLKKRLGDLFLLGAALMGLLVFHRRRL